MADLRHYQKFKENIKKKKIAGVFLNTTAELQQWAALRQLPCDLDDVPAWTTMTLPSEWLQRPGNVDAVMLTMHVQLSWIGQLTEIPGRFTLHIDCKHKVHHGDWLLVTVGTHSIEFNYQLKKISHSFRPLLYVFVKQHQSTDSIIYILRALRMCASSSNLHILHIYSKSYLKRRRHI